jgi:hypothetical protein
VDDEIQLAPFLLEGFEDRVQARHVGDVARQHDIRVQGLGQGRHPFLQHLALVGQRDLGAGVTGGLGDAPGDGTVVGHAHDQALLSGHQWRRNGHAILTLSTRMNGPPRKGRGIVHETRDKTKPGWPCPAARNRRWPVGSYRMASVASIADRPGPPAGTKKRLPEQPLSMVSR